MVLLLVFALLFAWVIQLFMDTARLSYVALKKHNLTASNLFEQSVSLASTWGFNAYVLLTVVILVLIIVAAIALRRSESEGEW